MPIAQLGERSVRIREVEGSNPFGSTSGKLPLPRRAPHFCGVRCFLRPRFQHSFFFSRTEPGRNWRSRLRFFFCLAARVYSRYLFCQHFSGGKLPLPRRELHFCEVRAFSCPRLWFQALPPSAEVIGSFSRLFLFFAVPSEPKSLGSLIYEPSLPQKRWFSKRDAASRGSCISFS